MLNVFVAEKATATIFKSRTCANPSTTERAYLTLARNWTTVVEVNSAGWRPTLSCPLLGYKSRRAEETRHTYNALEQLWSRRQFSRSEATSPRTNGLSSACFPREWVARCEIFVSRADVRLCMWPLNLSFSSFHRRYKHKSLSDVKTNKQTQASTETVHRVETNKRNTARANRGKWKN